MFNGYEFGDQGDVATFTVDPFSNVDPVIAIEIEKCGGGEIGRAYAGTWNYRVTLPDGSILDQGCDLVSGSLQTHEQMARTLADFLAHSGGADCDEIEYGYAMCMFAQGPEA